MWTTTQPVLRASYEAFVQFVRENYNQKIVEVGVGLRLDVAENLKAKMSMIEVIVTDTQESIIRSYRGSGVRAILDNVLSPRLPVYQGASLIYSLNPPIEIISALERLAKDTGADLLVRPMSDEQEIFYGNSNWQRITRQGQVIGWLYTGNSHAQG